MKIGFVVEGKSDQIFLESNKEWFEKKGLDFLIIPCFGKPGVINHAIKHLKSLRLKGCDKIIFLIDRDKDKCVPLTTQRLEHVRKEKDVIICVVSRDLECWLLSDSKAIKKIIGKRYKYEPPDFTDDIKNAKEIIKNLLKKKFKISFSEIEIAEKVSKHFSFERAKEKNKSLKRFVNKIKQCLNVS